MASCLSIIIVTCKGLHIHIIFVLLYILVYPLVTGSSNTVCTINDSRRTEGICKPLANCSAVIGLLKAGVNPTPCSPQGSAMVCCPSKKRISSEKCDEFMKVLTQPIKANHALSFDGNHIEKHQDDEKIKCETFFIGFISGGRNARPREYPYQVALGYGDKPDWRCGGTLIDPSYVVTAAHCVRTAYGPPKFILLGDRKLSYRRDSSRLLVNVSEIYVHPQYEPPLQYNDIAILKLATSVKISRAVLPACIPNPHDRLDRAIGVEATGWGQTGAFDGQSDILQSATLGKFSTEECSSFFGADNVNKNRLPKGIIKSQFCAGDKNGLRDTCKGDSGGPVTVSKEDDACIHYLVGITSFGSNLCGFQQPGVYTNVLSFINFIEDIVWSNLTTEDKSKLYPRVTSYDNGLIFNPSLVQPVNVKSTERPTLPLRKPVEMSTNPPPSSTTIQSIPTQLWTTTPPTPSSTTIQNIPTQLWTTAPPTPSLSSRVSFTAMTTESIRIQPQITISPPLQHSLSTRYNFFNISGTIADLLNKISIGR